MRTPKIPGLLAASLLVLLACNLPGTVPAPATPTVPAPEAIFTSAAQTVIAQITEITFASATLLPPTQVQPQSSATLAPSSTPILTPTSLPTFTPPATPIPPATATKMPPPTATPRPCNAVEFVADVTAPDNTTFSPGMPFTKIWRLKNAGSCTWTTQYSLVFVDGEKMDGPSTQALTQSVPPGGVIDLSVKLEAPGSANRYTGNWMLRSASGANFGIGAKYDKVFWVKIKVVALSENITFDLGIDACAAVWRSEAGRLPCPGNKNDKNGSIQVLQAPNLEDGRKENEPTLWTIPQQVAKGYITGNYPAYTIQNGDHFITHLGCLADSAGCKVTFRLDYMLVSTGEIFNLGVWEEKFDGAVTVVDLDLSSLAGKKVEFILVVKAKESPANDWAFWLHPHISHVP